MPLSRGYKKKTDEYFFAIENIWKCRISTGSGAFWRILLKKWKKGIGTTEKLYRQITENALFCHKKVETDTNKDKSIIRAVPKKKQRWVEIKSRYNLALIGTKKAIFWAPKETKSMQQKIQIKTKSHKTVTYRKTIKNRMFLLNFQK